MILTERTLDLEELPKKPVKVVIRLIRDAKRAENLWSKFCKPRTVWDLWEVRKAFLNVYKYKILFVVAKVRGKTVGVLPLWYSKSAKAYEWISGWYAEESYPFTKSKIVLQMMLDRVDGKVVLEAMKYGAAKLFPGRLVRDFDHYGLNLKKVGYDWDKYLMSIKKKKRENIRKDIRTINAKNPVISYDNLKDLKYLFSLNKKQMRRKVKIYADETLSIFETDKKQEAAYKEMWKCSGGRYKVRLITVRIGKKVVGCDFNLIYKNKYYTVIGGTDIQACSGIGVYMNYLDIQDGIAKGCNYVDFLMENHYWKEDWFKPERRYKFEMDKQKTE